VLSIYPLANISSVFGWVGFLAWIRSDAKCQLQLLNGDCSPRALDNVLTLGWYRTENCDKINLAWQCSDNHKLVGVDQHFAASSTRPNEDDGMWSWQVITRNYVRLVQPWYRAAFFQKGFSRTRWRAIFSRQKRRLQREICLIQACVVVSSMHTSSISFEFCIRVRLSSSFRRALVWAIKWLTRH